MDLCSAAASRVAETGANSRLGVSRRRYRDAPIAAPRGRVRREAGSPRHGLGVGRRSAPRLARPSISEALRLRTLSPGGERASELERGWCQLSRSPVPPASRFLKSVGRRTRAESGAFASGALGKPLSSTTSIG
jgi:hypothetical protein